MINLKKKIFYMLFFMCCLIFLTTCFSFVIFNNNVKAIENETLNKAKMYIDNPTYMQMVNNKMYIRGWVMSDTQNIDITLYIDNKIMDTLQRNEEREDVIKAIIGYRGREKNPIPGFEKYIDISELEDKLHILRIDVKDKNSGKILTQEQILINVKKYDAKIYIDNPEYMQNNKYDMYLRGWVMSQTENVDINLYIDNNLVYTLQRNEEREDVIKAIAGYGGRKKNPIPGFEKHIDISSLKDGIHTLKIEVKNSITKEILNYETTKFNIQKNDVKMYIDNPIYMENVNNKIYIRGWVMSYVENININIYIDGKLIDTIKQRNEEREDVIKAIAGYGGREKNPIPGFEKYIDVLQLLDGTHKLKVEVVKSNTSEILTKEELIINLKKYKAKIYIDNPLYNEYKEDKLYIRGWIMADTQNIDINLYIDDNFVKKLQRNEQREDVIKAIIGYGGREKNPIPGFEDTIDISKLEGKKYKIKIEVINNETNELLCIDFVDVNLNNKQYYYGIDVSYYQGEIDWKKVKNDNIDFAILRAGFRGWGTSRKFK